MDIEIERRADVGVAQYDAHGLVVAVARTNFASEKLYMSDRRQGQ